MTEPGFAPETEAPQLGGAIGRMLAALQRRAAAGDSAAFEELLLIERVIVPEQVRLAGRALHDAGYSYTDIARFAGTTRASAQQRYA